MSGGMAGAPGSGKAGMTKRSSEALGRLLRSDNRGARGPTRRGRLIALVFLVVLFAGWGVWDLAA